VSLDYLSGFGPSIRRYKYLPQSQQFNFPVSRDLHNNLSFRHHRSFFPCLVEQALVVHVHLRSRHGMAPLIRLTTKPHTVVCVSLSVPMSMNTSFQIVKNGKRRDIYQKRQTAKVFHADGRQMNDMRNWDLSLQEFFRLPLSTCQISNYLLGSPLRVPFSENYMALT
jgi:hypothetical protein